MIDDKSLPLQLRRNSAIAVIRPNKSDPLDGIAQLHIVNGGLNQITQTIKSGTRQSERGTEMLDDLSISGLINPEFLSK